MRRPVMALVVLGLLAAGCSFAPEAREPTTVLHLPAEYAAAPVDSADANVSRICGLYPLEYATGSPERRSARIIAR